jgi:hypothetical protein
MLLLAAVTDEMELRSTSSMTPDYNRSCKYSQVLLMMGENIARNM